MGASSAAAAWATSAPSVVGHANDRGEWANMNGVAMIESTRRADGRPSVHRRRFMRMGGARVGARSVAALRESPPSRFRSLGLAHERAARRLEAGRNARRKQAGGRGRDGGSREGRERCRRRSRGCRDRAGSGAGRTDGARRGRIHGVARRLRARLRGRGDGHGRP